MTQQNLDFAELQELKNQFNLLNEKLEKQRIINEELIQESMKEKLSYIERWYSHQYQKNTIATPITSIIFMILYLNNGFGHWGFSVLILFIGILQYFLYRRCYHALDIKNLPNMNMTQATENVIKHQQHRVMTNKILLLPTIALIVWTIVIASGYTWNLKIVSLTTFLMGLSISWGVSQMKKNQKRLESVLEQIKKLRE